MAVKKALSEPLTDDETALTESFIHALRQPSHIIVIISPHLSMASVEDSPLEDAILETNRVIWGLDELKDTNSPEVIK